MLKLLWHDAAEGRKTICHNCHRWIVEGTIEQIQNCFGRFLRVYGSKNDV